MESIIKASRMTSKAWADSILLWTLAVSLPTRWMIKKKTIPPTLVPFFLCKRHKKSIFYVKWRREKEKFLEFTFRMCLQKFSFISFCFALGPAHTNTPNTRCSHYANGIDTMQDEHFPEKQWRIQSPIMCVKRKPFGEFTEEILREVSEWIQGLAHRTGGKGKLLSIHTFCCTNELYCVLWTFLIRYPYRLKLYFDFDLWALLETLTKWTSQGFFWRKKSLIRWLMPINLSVYRKLIIAETAHQHWRRHCRSLMILSGIY